MTKQDTLDIVASHLLTQGKRSQAKFPSNHYRDHWSFVCAYRGDNGCKCSAGKLIDDKDYRPSMELASISSNPAVMALLERDGHEIYLVKELQKIHDLYDPEGWRDALLSLASSQNLSPKIILEHSPAIVA